MTVFSSLIGLCLFALQTPVASAQSGSIHNLPANLIKTLAESHKPDQNGALGRNKKGYFHVRFQYRMHHVAEYAVFHKHLEAAELFIKALEYGFKHQNDDGGFAIKIPAEMARKKKATQGDLASGTSFFLASVGVGLLALEQADYLNSSQLENRIKAMKPRLLLALQHLMSQQRVLENYNAMAPNRLFFDALALQSMGEFLQHEQAKILAKSFVQRALSQQHQDGYFIERGGYDSSYNAVALATGYRLLVMMPEHEQLAAALTDSMRWHQTRVLNTGEVLLSGNSRVHPNGEAFLGRKKDLDVYHAIEAFMWSYVVTGDTNLLSTAKNILQHYQQKQLR